MIPDPQSGSETYVITDSTAESVTRAEVETLVATIDKIDLYIPDQIGQFLQGTGFTLRTLLAVDEQSRLDDVELMGMLISDMSQLHRQQVLVGIRLLIIEPWPARNGMYRVLYQSRYRMNPDGMDDAGTPAVTNGEAGGKLHISRDVARGRVPVLVLEWKRGLTSSAFRAAQRDAFFFQWETPGSQWDGTGLVTTSRGMLVADGKVVVARSVSITRDQVGR